MAFSPEGSLPYEAKKQDRIRHKKERSYYDSTDKFGQLTLLTKEMKTVHILPLLFII